MALIPVLSLAGSSAARAAENKPATGKMDEATPPPVVAAEIVTAPFTVEDIDKSHRKLTLRSPEGDKTTVSVPAEVKGFDQVKKGDKIEVDYYRAVAVAVLPPGTAAPAVQERQEMKHTTVGGLETHEITASAQILSISHKDNTIRIKGPDGKIQTVSVKDPDVQKELGSLKPGDVVQLTYTEGVAAALRPQRK